MTDREITRAAAEEISLQGRRVLLAEDVPLNAELVAGVLGIEGIETDHAVNGAEALEMFSSSPGNYYDAILMDVIMPAMDGLASARAIRALDRPDAGRVPIIAMSANAEEEDISLSLEAGMDEHLAKPVDALLLFDTLRRLIARREAED